MGEFLSLLSATAVSSSDFDAVITSLQSQISVASVVEILGKCVGVGVGFAFMWWGVRKVTRALMAAFKKGKISI